ncbi:ATP-dependent helicase/nuclease subunit A [Andreprevotia sp. IGB-42]|uniref:UvrD-helicase domain-containing protein n=1 Tax=Andreprevotia sp. IGB-42 TaxID=2497473 RepID=UPI001359E6BA|nr:UvrD-helicase domain-containing protein [Andreprevotia sp. IGB-42]KAF0814208.1 ATP-dependent helicase/nuclease subunit A [Andreprevotia sp. IGB-42]
MSRQPQDWQARLAALDPARSFLVQAPAGSGKTELLTDRILALLPTVSRPEEVVAITFTRKAAAEMHARVMQKLARARGPAPETEHALRSWQLAGAVLAHDAEQGWHLLDHPGRLTIQTIDSFCAGLVRRMPYLSQLGGMPATVDDARPHYQAAARATLAMAGDELLGAPIRLLLSHLDVDLKATEELLAAMLASRDQWLPLLGGLANAFDATELAQDRALLEYNLRQLVVEEMRSLVDAMPMGWYHELAPVARAAAEALEAEKPGVLTALMDWQGELLATGPEALPQWQALRTLLLTGGKPRSPRGLSKNLGFPVGCAHKAPMADWLDRHGMEAQAAWAQRLDAVDVLPVPRFTDAQWHTLAALLTTLKLAAAQLLVRFAEQGEVDFTEIASRAVAALGQADEPSDLLLRLDARIHHLLIDEFQDTSQPQIDLLGKLTAGWQAGDGRTLFLVGDPMQSIYRFRKADVGLFLAARDHGVGEIAPQFLALTDNFRSQAGIVDWVNLAFARLFPAQDDAENSAIAYARSAAFNPALPDYAVCFHPVWRRDSELPAQAEADVVLALVQQALAHDESGNVAILVRAKNHAHRIARKLAQAGIAHKAVDLVPLAQRPVVADLVQLTRALCHAGDRLAWLCVLRAPWCGLSLHTLAALFGHDHVTAIPVLLAHAPRLAALDEDAAARVAAIVPILLDGSHANGSLPLAAHVAQIWRRLQGPQIYSAPRDAVDAERFFQLLETLAPYGALDPAALDDALASLFAAPDPAADRVEIMTMHKSKGLQFDTVILPGLHRKAPPDHPPLLRLEVSQGRLLLGPIKPLAERDADPLSRYLGERNKRRAAYELDRLLYVAATRAKRHLHLVGELAVSSKTGEIRQPQSSSLLARLLPVLPALTPPALVAAVDNDEAQTVAGPVFAALPADLLPAIQPIMEPERTYGRFSLAAQLVEAAVGTVVHAWLERIGNDGLAQWPAARLQQSLPLMIRQLLRAGLSSGDAASAAQTVLTTLQATLADARGRWLLTQAARREWRLIDAAGKVAVIDLALETADGWLVVDYKTANARDGEDEDVFAERMWSAHGEQLALYCNLLAALTGKPVSAALYLPRAGRWLERTPVAKSSD